ncbi:putative CtpA-like serine protease [Polaribacter huanghezhanensis]|uniref:S41 family peptidase n=1 Tax=Polaribacter huanghezhanensis TaxID=1354726 RepID=UPI002647CD13|nr:S41 family peptidase [Polaribacter huanghezhanensis]WKD85542.1 putative CtpA-like serine protease [Polaribacter huanghezhanensis]
MKKNIKNKTIVGVLIAIVFVSFSFQSKFFEVAKQIEIYTTLFKELNMYYVNEINPAEFTTRALKNTLKDLDPYTNYYNEQDVEAVKIRREGEYGGIGAAINYGDKNPLIVRVYKGYSADKAGLKPGDIITKIDNQVLAALEKEDASSLLLGIPESKVFMEINRQGKTISIHLKREKIEINPVPFYKKIDDETGYIVLTRFNEKAASEVKKAFENLKKKGIKSLILDLRSNPGGLLGEAVNISNFFLPKGTTITTTKAKVKKWSNIYLSRNNPLDLEIPMVVLINGSSASASEIVTGALQDYDRAVVIGKRSFGKGLVQRFRALSYGTQLKVTVSKYYTPSGRCIQELDYANRDLKTGKVPKFSDAGINEFRTQNGRKVFDGGGIHPDIITENETVTEETKILLSSRALFNFAINFKNKNNTITSAKDFRFTDNNFKQFQSFLKVDTTFITKEEASFKEAYRTLNTSQNQKIKTAYSRIISTLKSEKIKELISNKELIKNELKNIILDQYYYQEGIYQNKIASDKTVLEAVKLLKNSTKYNQILSGKK